MKTKTGYLCLATTIIFFSTLEVISRTISGVSPFQLTFLRFLIGGAVLFAVMLLREGARISRRDFLWCALLGALNVCGSMNLLQFALSLEGSSAAVCAVLISSNPIFVSVLASKTERRKLSAAAKAGLVIGLAGVACVSLIGKNAGGSLASPLIAFAAALLFAVYTVLGRSVSARIGSLKMNAYAFLTGSALIAPFLVAFKIPVFAVLPDALAGVLYLGVFVTGVAYLTYFHGLVAVGAGKGSLVFFAKPVIASLAAWVILREAPGAGLYAGIPLVALGIALVLFGDRLLFKRRAS